MLCQHFLRAEYGVAEDYFRRAIQKGVHDSRNWRMAHSNLAQCLRQQDKLNEGMAVFRPLVLPQLEIGATRFTDGRAPDVETILAANNMFALMAMASNWDAFELVEHAVTTAEKVSVV